MLIQLLLQSAERFPEATAVVCGPEAFSYRQIVEESARIAHGLRSLGVGHSDRVAIWMKKSPKTVAAMQAVLQLGAVYVPLDPVGPVQRAATILKDCGVSALIHDRSVEEFSNLDLAGLPTLSLSPGGKGDLCWADIETLSAEITPADRNERDLAFILYTSGSTGTPKGVCITHGNALAFVNWAADEVGITASDRLSNHAPFHFDLSVFDLYAAFSRGASVHIVPEVISYLGKAVSNFIFENRITVWYSVPTAIVLMCEHGDFLQTPNYSLRTMIFAGEVFPIQKLARVQQAHKNLRLLNFFGPTETNVCTFHEVTDDLQTRTRPVPIGFVCSGNQAWALKEDGNRATAPGDEGELIVQGPTVMAGYWGKQPLPSGHCYATGDLVRLLPDRQFDYLGRKDNMLKIQGFRVEPGEIEAALSRYQGVDACAVVAIDVDGRKELVAFVVCKDIQQPSLIQLKGHCAALLPQYMVIQRVRFLDAFPRTPNGKIDRMKLTLMVTENV